MTILVLHQAVHPTFYNKIALMDILNNSRENFVIDIKQISGSCPHQFFSKIISISNPDPKKSQVSCRISNPDPVHAPEVAGVTFSDSDSAPAPTVLNPGPVPGPAILQI